MGHPHQHSSGNIKEKSLIVVTGLNLVITIAEFIGGLLSNSLSLLSDALHNLSDTLALLIALIAHKISKKPSNLNKTFGYQRAEILAAFVNASVLIFISFYLFIEAWKRFVDPEPIKGKLMFIVAIIGLLANLISVLILHKDNKTNMNIKAAYLHLIGDTLSSVAVIVGGILIMRFKWYWVDPLITVLVALYIAKETYSILKESINILMQATPKNVDLIKIEEDIKAMEEIKSIHHIHAWNLNESSSLIEMHVDLNKDLPISETETIIVAVEKLLYEKYNIKHVTLQFEFNRCDNKALINKSS